MGAGKWTDLWFHPLITRLYLLAWLLHLKTHARRHQLCTQRGPKCTQRKKGHTPRGQNPTKSKTRCNKVIWLTQRCSLRFNWTSPAKVIQSLFNFKSWFSQYEAWADVLFQIWFCHLRILLPTLLTRGYNLPANFISSELRFLISRAGWKSASNGEADFEKIILLVKQILSVW